MKVEHSFRLGTSLCLKVVSQFVWEDWKAIFFFTLSLKWLCKKTWDKLDIGFKYLVILPVLHSLLSIWRPLQHNIGLVSMATWTNNSHCYRLVPIATCTVKFADVPNHFRAQFESVVTNSVSFGLCNVVSALSFRLHSLTGHAFRLACTSRSPKTVFSWWCNQVQRVLW